MSRRAQFGRGARRPSSGRREWRRCGAGTGRIRRFPRVAAGQASAVGDRMPPFDGIESASSDGVGTRPAAGRWAGAGEPAWPTAGASAADVSVMPSAAAWAPGRRPSSRGRARLESNSDDDVAQLAAEVLLDPPELADAAADLPGDVGHLVGAEDQQARSRGSRGSRLGRATASGFLSAGADARTAYTLVGAERTEPDAVSGRWSSVRQAAGQADVGLAEAGFGACGGDGRCGCRSDTGDLATIASRNSANSRTVGSTSSEWRREATAAATAPNTDTPTTTQTAHGHGATQGSCDGPRPRGRRTSRPRRAARAGRGGRRA